MFQRIELILIPSIALDTIVLIILFSRRGSYRSARDGVAAEGTSCMHGTHGTKKCITLDYFQQPVSKMPPFFFSGCYIKKMIGIRTRPSIDLRDRSRGPQNLNASKYRPQKLRLKIFVSLRVFQRYGFTWRRKTQ